MNISVLKQDRSGFALIEIIIALFIIGIMISIGAPRLFRAGATPLDNFVSQLNILMQDGYQLASKENKVVKINFNFKNKKVELKKLEDNKEILIDVTSIPEVIALEQLYINQKDEPGKDEAWIFINQDGVVQECILNITLEDKSGKKSERSLVLNPFTVQFKIYDTFKKPEK